MGLPKSNYNFPLYTHITAYHILFNFDIGKKLAAHVDKKVLISSPTHCSCMAQLWLPKHLDGDPVRTGFTQPVGKVGAIFREGVAAEGDSAIVREEVGIKEHLSITIQGRLDVQHNVRGNREKGNSSVKLAVELCT